MRGDMAKELWIAAGSPRLSSGMFTDGTCEQCGAPSIGEKCDPCAWVELGKPPDSYRMWSALWREDWEAPASNPKVSPKLLLPRLHLFTRGTPEHAVACLCCPPACRWAMAVTTSGQIHTIGRASINYSGQWTIPFERELVTSTPREFTALLGAVMELRSLKYTTEEIESRDWPVNKVSKNIEAWMRWSSVVAKHHGSAVLALACFLSKDTTDA